MAVDDEDSQAEVGLVQPARTEQSQPLNQLLGATNTQSDCSSANEINYTMLYDNNFSCLAKHPFLFNIHGHFQFTHHFAISCTFIPPVAHAFSCRSSSFQIYCYEKALFSSVVWFTQHFPILNGTAEEKRNLAIEKRKRKTHVLWLFPPSDASSEVKRRSSAFLRIWLITNWAPVL